jgi:hypothetical protein
MESTNQALRSGKTTATNPAKTIHRATTSIDPRVPHTTTITSSISRSIQQMESTNQALRSGKTTATNPAKTIHRATTSIDPRVPHTTTITTTPTATNPTPRSFTKTTPPPYPTDSKGKTAS